MGVPLAAVIAVVLIVEANADENKIGMIRLQGLQEESNVVM